MHFRVDVFFVCTCFSVSSALRPVLTLECYLTVVSCPRHLRWNTTKIDYSDSYSHIRPVLEELCKLCLMRSSCYHFNLSDRCDSRDLNFLYAWRMTIVVSWVRIYQKAFMCSENSEIVLRKVRILTLSGEVGILTLRSAFPELLVRKVRIGTKWEYMWSH